MSGPYAYAREVAMRIAERPGATARELYRLFGDRFHEWNYDGHQEANVIAQHLSKFEEDGLVISEKKGKERSAPRTWTWVGPKPNHLDTAATDHPINVHDQDDRKPDYGMSDVRHSDAFTDEILATEQNVSPDDHGQCTAITESLTALDTSDHLDMALLSIRQIAKAMARPLIDRRDEKIACLAKLAAITSPDIAELLREIAEDIQ